MSLISVVIFFAGNAYSEEEKVYLSVPDSYNLLIDIDYYKNELVMCNGKKETQQKIIEKEKLKIANLFKLNSLCSENYDIKKQQAEEWEKEYLKTVEQLKKAKQTPWYKFDMKSLTVGGVVVLLLKLAL